ncbi:MAG: 16S rRNA (guanine(527)-N(7))-methyltransferase RsmG [Bacteroidota bacterium]
MDKLAWLRSVCQKNGLTIAESRLDVIQRYVSLLLDWNRKINLISRRDESNVWERHILHSIAMLFKLQLMNAGRVLDLGAGGGLPGIPIKIIISTLQLTCLDSVRKKTIALENILRQLSLTDAEVVWGRAEQLGMKDGFRSKYDYVLCRAVGPLTQLVKWSEPFLKRFNESVAPETTGEPYHRYRVPAGSLIAWKGGDLDREFKVARTLKSVRSITVVPLVFKGSETMEASDKQLVIVSLN